MKFVVNGIHKCKKEVSNFSNFLNFFLLISFELMSYPIAKDVSDISDNIGCPISPSPAITCFLVNVLTILQTSD